MKTQIKKRKMLLFGLGIPLAMLLTWSGTPALTDAPGSDPAPELVIPVVTRNSKIHISGSFTCDKRKDCFLADGTPIIELRTALRVIDANGLTQCVNNILGSVALDPSDPSGKRLAFRGTIDLAEIFKDDQGEISATLFLDATNAREKGTRQAPSSLGWFTGAAFADLNGDNRAVIAVQLVQPQRDSLTLNGTPWQ